MNTVTVSSRKSLSFRRAMRDAAGAARHVPVVVVDGVQPPTVRGRGYYWTTPSGKTEVHHPNAYGWPVVYHASTRRVEVGRDSLQARLWSLAGGLAAE